MVSSKVENEIKGLASFRSTSSSKHGIPCMVSIMQEYEQEYEIPQTLTNVSSMEDNRDFESSMIKEFVYTEEREKSVAFSHNPSGISEANFSYTSQGTNSINEGDQRYMTSNKSLSSKMSFFRKMSKKEKELKVTGTFSVDGDSCYQRYTPTIEHQETALSMDYSALAAINNAYVAHAEQKDKKVTNVINEKRFDEISLNFDEDMDILNEVVHTVKVQRNKKKNKYGNESISGTSTKGPTSDDSTSKTSNDTDSQSLSTGVAPDEIIGENRSKNSKEGEIIDEEVGETKRVKAVEEDVQNVSDVKSITREKVESPKKKEEIKISSDVKVPNDNKNKVSKKPSAKEKKVVKSAAKSMIKLKVSSVAEKSDSKQAVENKIVKVKVSGIATKEEKLQVNTKKENTIQKSKTPEKKETGQNLKPTKRDNKATELKSDRIPASTKKGASKIVEVKSKIASAGSVNGAKKMVDIKSKSFPSVEDNKGVKETVEVKGMIASVTKQNKPKKSFMGRLRRSLKKKRKDTPKEEEPTQIVPDVIIVNAPIMLVGLVEKLKNLEEERNMKAPEKTNIEDSRPEEETVSTQEGMSVHGNIDSNQEAEEKAISNANNWCGMIE